MNTTAGPAVCRCKHCGGDIEFDPATFQVSRQSRSITFGQAVTCSTCGLETELTLPRKLPPSRSGQILLFIAGAGVILFAQTTIATCGGFLLIAAGLILGALNRLAR